MAEFAITTPPREVDQSSRIRRRPQWSRITWLLGAWPVLLAFGGTALVGSLSIPHNDDWSYVKTARIFAETGHLEMQGWVATSMVGQVFLSYPILKVFGSSVVVLNSTMVLVSLGGLGAAYSVFRRFGTTSTAVLGTLTTSLFPGYLLLSTSFMSDVPAFAAMTACLAVGLHSVDQRSRTLLGVALTLGAIGVTFRYQAVAAPLAVLLVWALLPRQEGSRLRPIRSALMSGTTFAVFLVAFMWWRLTLPDVVNTSSSGLHMSTLVTSLVTSFPVLGLGLLPFIVLCVDRLLLLARNVETWLFLVASGAYLVLLHHARGDIFAGNYLDRFGPYQAAGYGTSPSLFPDVTWAFLSILAWFAATAALLLLLDAVRRSAIPRVSLPWTVNQDDAPGILIGGFAVLYFGALFAAAFLGFPVFDRYLLPLLVPLGTGLVIRAKSVPRRTLFSCAAAVGVLAIVAAVLTTASAKDDTIRWRASVHLLQNGASPRDVSSGLEWQGTFAAHPALGERMLTPMPVDQHAAFTRMFEGSRDCWFLTRTVSTSPHLRLIQAIHYTRFPGLPRGELDIYRTDLCS